MCSKQRSSFLSCQQRKRAEHASACPRRRSTPPLCRGRRPRSTDPGATFAHDRSADPLDLRGAEMIVQTIDPNVAIITDVCHDTTTPMINKFVEGDYQCGRGPVVTYGPSVHNILLDLIIDTADANGIPLQKDAASRSTGTDTDAFAYSNGGIPSALISLALRYMHTTVESVDKKDVEQVIELIYQTLLKLHPKFNFKYLK